MFNSFCEYIRHLVFSIAVLAANFPCSLDPLKNEIGLPQATGLYNFERIGGNVSPNYNI